MTWEGDGVSGVHGWPECIERGTYSQEIELKDILACHTEPMAQKVMTLAEKGQD